jgi:hypothetical protein
MRKVTKKDEKLFFEISVTFYSQAGTYTQSSQE